MRTIWLFLFLCLTHIFNIASAFEGLEPYRLRQGDALSVSVWREDALQKEVRVLPDGAVTFPLAGRVVVAGLSVPQAEERITERLKEFIPDPVVSIVVTGIEGSRVYVIGKVNKPGPVSLSVPMTVMQALSLASGLDKFAETDGIQVVRRTKEGVTLIPIKYGDLIRGRNVQSDILLQPNDTILVP